MNCPSSTVFLQKSFRVLDDSIVTLESAHPIEDRVILPREDPSASYAATPASRSWRSWVTPEALCSFASEPGVRAVIEASGLRSLKRGVVEVGSYKLVAVAFDYRYNRFHTAIPDGVRVFESADAMRKAFPIAKTRQIKELLKRR